MGTLCHGGSAQNVWHEKMVRVYLDCNGCGGPTDALHHPDYERHQRSEKQEWHEDDYRCPGSANRSDVATDLGFLSAANVAADHGGVAPNFRSLLQPNIAHDCGNITGDLPLIFDKDTSTYRRGVAVDLAADVNRAGNAGDIADLLPGLNVYRMADLRIAGVLLTRCGCRYRQKRKYRR